VKACLILRGGGGGGRVWFSPALKEHSVLRAFKYVLVQEKCIRT
jgi:hypothetical protein